jgi:hypothetical protein
VDDHAMNEAAVASRACGSPDQQSRGRRRPELRTRRVVAACLGAVALVSLGVLTVPPVAGASSGRTSGGSTPFLDTLHVVTNVSSTVPGNGDLNPYGIVTVPSSVGNLVQNSTLISNFNAKSNLQGTGTTIVQISRSGQLSVFADLSGSLPGRCPGGVGLTTALTILQGGYVVVGSLPVTKGGTGTPEAGCLIVLNSYGVPVETFAGSLINGPWDLTSVQVPGFAEVFVSNVLNGTVAGGGKVVKKGTVVRLLLALQQGAAPELLQETVIGTGFAEQLNSSAVVLGPTGLALGTSGTLYVADNVNSRIAAIPFAIFRFLPLGHGGHTLTEGGALSSPLGLMLAPNGDVIAVNGGNGNAVEVNPSGQQVANVQMDPLNSAGDLFGLTLSPSHKGILFVDDGDNTLKRFRP